MMKKIHYRMMVGMLVLPISIPGISFADPPVNLDFESELVGWSTEGLVEIQEGLAGNHVAVLRETNGGLSRVWQEFTLPGSIEWLSLRCRLFHETPPSGPWPPDSLTIYLVDAITGERLVGQGVDPGFTEAVIYQDSHFKNLAAEPFAFVDSAPPGDLQLIRIDVGSIVVDRDVRLEFAFNHIENETSSFAVVDGVQFDCPPGYCCSPDLSVINPIDDGLDCTDDICDPMTGIVTHDDDENCCPQCHDSSANVVIMIDVTGSINDTELEQEKTAARSFLQAFEQASPRPYVTIGRFSTNVAENAEIMTPSDWTTDYGFDGMGQGGSTGLYEAIDNITNSGGYTNIAAPIFVARSKIQTAPEPDLRKYIILISDGQPNRPEGNDGAPECVTHPTINCFSGCGSGTQIEKAAWCLADEEAELAESVYDISLIAVFYDGGSGCKHACGEFFMKNVIATLPPGVDPDDNPFFVDESASLVCSFNGIVQTISCDDGDPCTIDSCENGQCVYTPVDSPECGG